MMVIAGVFYQRARLVTRDAYLRAVELVARDVANEHNSARWA